MGKKRLLKRSALPSASDDTHHRRKKEDDTTTSSFSKNDDDNDHYEKDGGVVVRKRGSRLIILLGAGASTGILVSRLFLQQNQLGLLISTSYRTNGGSTNHHKKGTPYNLMEQDSTRTTSPCTDYVEYPQPTLGQGLPYLADVFASPDSQWIWFVGINRAACDPPLWKGKDNFMDFETRFICMFPHNVAVISEAVTPTGVEHPNPLLFKCQIPKQFQSQIIPHQTTTTLHIDLHSISNPDSPLVGINTQQVKHFPSQPIQDTPKIPRIPICHPGHASPPSPPQKGKKYNLVANTRVLASGPEKNVRNHWETIAQRIPEWIDYHLREGFDHFIFYDHSKQYYYYSDDSTKNEQTIPIIENITKPYVDAGLVTYRWWPFPDCTRNEPGKPLHGYHVRIGQGAAGVAALHRLGVEGTAYMAHMDVDEFFVVYDNDNNSTSTSSSSNKPTTTRRRKTVLDYVQEKLENKNNNLDALEFVPTVLDYCDGTIVDTTHDSNLEKRQCLTPSHASDVKLIMRTDRIMNYQVHYALSTWNWSKPNTLRIRDRPDGGDGGGFLAHLRGGEMKPGTKSTTFHQRVSYFDDFLKERGKATKTTTGVPYFHRFVNKKQKST